MSDVVDRLLDGAVDLHVHPYPSPFPRRLDAAEAAQRAADAGMRAIVVKSHHHDTSSDVAALRAMARPAYAPLDCANKDVVEQAWTKYEALKRSGDKLTRTETDPAASYTYAKC